MTINLLFFIVSIKKIPKTKEAAINEEQNRKLYEAYKAKACEYRNHHLL
ncbi:YrzI family small protein [Bacillus sp. AGMB 02131]|uniref:YrzI family small protein n=1 Tax=Peribacillus faecalis TaxID=2772559 RepID=A0A927CW83_9BACI|nr:YrzI family small protein [Peribacillus faecalis]MBD3107110.1 YrzI family small protein [Peribacillus faecalis]